MPTEKSYNHNDIVNDSRLGAKPSDEYLERVSDLDRAVRECMFVSRSYAGIPAPTAQHYYASVLFTALVTRAVSLINLAPHSPWAQKMIEHWDYSSATGIVRTMMELRFAFHYLCVDKCNSTEWECRWQIFNLHDCVTRKRLFEALDGQNDEVKKLEDVVESLRDRLKVNAFFSCMSVGQQRKILQGQTAFLLPLEDLGKKAGINKNTFRMIWTLFSSHVHGLPFSFYRIGEGDGERGRGLPSHVEEGYTSLCLSFATAFLIKTRDELHALFAGLISPDLPNAEESEKEASNNLSAPDGFPIGACVTLITTASVRVEVTRTKSDEIEIIYFHRETNEVVLQRYDSEGEGARLNWFDPVFWTVTINGKPSTEKALLAIGDRPWAFKIDADALVISIKFEP